MKILGHNSNHQEMVVKQKAVDLHDSGFKLKFPKHNKIGILGNFYQCNCCYAKLEQHCTKRLCAHNSPIIQLFVQKNVSTLHLSAFSQKFSNYGLLYFRYV